MKEKIKRQENRGSSFFLAVVFFWLAQRPASKGEKRAAERTVRTWREVASSRRRPCRRHGTHHRAYGCGLHALSASARITEKRKKSRIGRKIDADSVAIGWADHRATLKGPGARRTRIQNYLVPRRQRHLRPSPCRQRTSSHARRFPSLLTNRPTGRSPIRPLRATRFSCLPSAIECRGSHSHHPSAHPSLAGALFFLFNLPLFRSTLTSTWSRPIHRPQREHHRPRKTDRETRITIGSSVQRQQRPHA